MKQSDPALKYVTIPNKDAICYVPDLGNQIINSYLQIPQPLQWYCCLDICII